jgi:hypothetical protein
MNFKHMPELEWVWGYPAALGFMAAVVTGIVLWFRHRGWIGGGDESRSDAPRGDAPRSDAPRGDAPRGDAPRWDARETRRMTTRSRRTGGPRA